MKLFETYKQFCGFIMNYEGELTVIRSEIYKDGILVGKMIAHEQ